VLSLRRPIAEVKFTKFTAPMHVPPDPFRRAGPGDAAGFRRALREVKFTKFTMSRIRRRLLPEVRARVARLRACADANRVTPEERQVVRES
jgi:hypothetical protein